MIFLGNHGYVWVCCLILLVLGILDLARKLSTALCRPSLPIPLSLRPQQTISRHGSLPLCINLSQLVFSGDRGSLGPHRDPTGGRQLGARSQNFRKLQFLAVVDPSKHLLGSFLASTTSSSLPSFLPFLSSLQTRPSTFPLPILLLSHSHFFRNSVTTQHTTTQQNKAIRQPNPLISNSHDNTAYTTPRNGDRKR